MNIEFLLYGQFRQKAGVEQAPIDLAEGTSLHQALAALAARHGDELARMLLETSGRVHPNLVCLVNDVPVSEATHVLNDGDRVALFTPLAGG